MRNIWNIRFENIFLGLVIPFNIFQVIKHLGNGVTFGNMIMELMLFIMIDLAIYSAIKTERLGK